MLEYLKSYRKTIITHLIALVLGGLLLGCGTKTKLKTEIENELNAKLEQKEAEESKRIDSIVVSKVEEAKREFSQIAKENSTEEATRTTTTETTETVLNPNDFREVKGTGYFLNDKNGQIIERKTKTIIEERFKAEKQKETETRLIEEERRKKDSIAQIEVFTNKMREIAFEVANSNKEKVIDVKKSGMPLIWKIGIGLFLLILICIWIFRKWLAIQFPFLGFLNRKRKE